MAANNRLVIDLVTDEPLSEHRLKSLAREASNNLHIVLTDPDDEVHEEVVKYAEGHYHEQNGDRCSYCVEMSLDYRSGDNVVTGNV